jgi:FtsP/CotA-like multicopper oxidase with cupredoxin domain
MNDDTNYTTRRQFLAAAGFGALAASAVGGGLAATARGGSAARAAAGLAAAGAATRLGLVGTDGHIILPNRPNNQPVYIFGFIRVPPDQTVANLAAQYRGKARTPAPLLDFTAEQDVNIQLTNVGLPGRPDLIDSHTVHWHGFRTPLTVFDGVPEVSIAVPQSRQFTYFYRPHAAGTYMYHCHFEDVEHVQMGMTGIVFVRPAGNPKWAYNDSTTAFDREFAILLNEIWTTVHDNDEQIQESVETDYKPNYWILNGRVYPQTILGNDDSSLPQQPMSSLVQVNEGEKMLLRLANLGYQQHAMQLPGIPLHVIGEDATPLRNASGADLSYWTNTLYIGPGEARDVLFTAPAFSSARPVATDAVGPHNTYIFKNTNAWKLTNNGAPGLGGMMTEVRVYPAGVFPAYTGANQVVT